jgi:hypothetical protein
MSSPTCHQGDEGDLEIFSGAQHVHDARQTAVAAALSVRKKARWTTRGTISPALRLRPGPHTLSKK